jgi:hypothetical protein
VLPETLAVIATVRYTGGPGFTCLEFPPSYVGTCVFGRLPAGDYVARFTEVHAGGYDPIPTTVQTRSFTVSAVTPVSRRSWGALKTIYR